MTVPSNDAVQHDHLFISYAWEDQAFAKWLALRLTSEGYKVWIDQFKLLGGESWPTDIDLAIKTRTFRMLGLLSKHSISKPNPVKERTLALNIAKLPNRNGFLIPLNVDGLRATDLDWLSSDITFINFSKSWARGIEQLFKLLDRENCPKFTGDGRSIVSQISAASDVITDSKEILVSNSANFKQIPEKLFVYSVGPALDGSFQYEVARDWAYYRVSPQKVIAFHRPPGILDNWLQPDLIRESVWKEREFTEGINSANIVSALLRESVETECRRRGMIWSKYINAFYFGGRLSADLPVELPGGTRTTFQSSGQKTFFRVGQPKTPYRYRLAIKLIIEHDNLQKFLLKWRVRAHFTDASDVPLPSTMQLSRRKHLTRSWYNRHWAVRYLGIMQFLQDSDGLIRIGPDGTEQIVLDCSPISFTVPKSIDENRLEGLEELGDEIPASDEEIEGNDETPD